MSKLLLHPSTTRALAAMAVNLPQAMLVNGLHGSGKTHTMWQWLSQELHAQPAQIRIIKPDEKAGISVAQVRDLYRATRDKLTEPQYFILPHAGNMSIGAQNAFLKLLEEPNQHIHFILTVSSLQEVLPTIQSRTQQLHISPVADTDLQQYLRTEFTLEPAALAQITFVAAGRVGTAARLASDPKKLDEQRQLATLAKTFVGGSTFEKLQTIQQLGNDRPKAVALLELSAAMTSRLLRRSKPSEQPRLVQQLGLIHETLERLSANANVKLQLTRSALLA